MFKNNLTGQKFGRLTVVEYLPDKHKWLCKCDCGNYKEIFTSKLTSLHTKSCGCLKNKYKITTHRIFSIWTNMLDYSFEEAINKKPRLNKNSIILTYKGEEMNLTMLAEICGLSVATVSKHIKRGDSAEQIIELANKLKR
jgi:hypothetical protein